MRKRIEDLIAWGQALSIDYARNRSSLAAGGLAYFVALSVVPAALAFGTIAGVFLDPQDVRTALEALAAKAPDTMGNLQPAVEGLVGMVAGASASAFTVTTLVSLVIAIYASSKVVLGLRMAMNTVFGVVETRGGLIERGISAVITLVGLVAAVGVVVLLTLVPRVLEWLGVTGYTTSTGNWLLDWLVVVALVYLSVRWVLHHAPNQGQRVRWNSLGVAVATVWIVGVTGGVGIYVHFSASLGAAVLVFGTAIVVLLWLYLCFVGLLWGATVEAHGRRAADA